MATCPACKGDFDAHYCPRDGNRLLVDEPILGDRYKLIRKVGEGAMGEVHEATHIHLNRRVAVKLLKPMNTKDAEAAARLQREARSTTGLGHPNIVDTIDFGATSDGRPYLVMEWLEGENLDQRLGRGPIELEVALDIAAQTCAGVAAAHDRGVIHRDLKPANLFLTRDHRGALLVKVLDFGIAKLVLHETKLTATGVLMGTPNYMAPEQAEGFASDARTDVYALGVILYEMFTGTVPFQGETPLSVLHQHTSRLPILPSARAPERGISDALDQLVMRCLAKQPAERFASMQDLGDAIAAVHPSDAPRVVRAAPAVSSTERASREAASLAADEEPMVPARRRWPIVVGLAAAAAIAGGAALLLRGGEAGERSGERRAALDAAVIAAPADARLVVDAASIAVSPSDAPGPAATFVVQGHHAHGQLLVRPDKPMPDASNTLAFELDLGEPRLRDAAVAGHLRATIGVEYYKTDTLVAPPTTVTVPADGRFEAPVTLRHASKHHVHLELSIDGTEVDHAKIDLWPELR